MSVSKIVVLGGNGFLGKHVVSRFNNPMYEVLCVSRSKPNWELAQNCQHLPLDVITDLKHLTPHLKDSACVINLIGLMYENPPNNTFNKVHNELVSELAKLTKSNKTKMIQISAIGANKNSNIPYSKTKGLGEHNGFEYNGSVNFIRPSLIFGKEDNFFNRFANLAKILPFVPVFNKGKTLYQPVFVDDVAEAIYEINKRDIKGKIVELGGPQILSYREMMLILLNTIKSKKPVISTPNFIGKLQGFVMEKLPENLFTITRDQISLLSIDNVVNKEDKNTLKFEDLNISPKSLAEILPTYIS